MHSFTNSFFVRSLINLVFQSFNYSYIHSVILPFIHSLAHSFAHSFPQSFIRSINHSVMHVTPTMHFVMHFTDIPMVGDFSHCPFSKLPPRHGRALVVCGKCWVSKWLKMLAVTMCNQCSNWWEEKRRDQKFLRFPLSLHLAHWYPINIPILICTKHLPNHAPHEDFSDFTEQPHVDIVPAESCGDGESRSSTTTIHDYWLY